LINHLALKLGQGDALRDAYRGHGRNGSGGKTHVRDHVKGHPLKGEIRVNRRGSEDEGQRGLGLGLGLGFGFGLELGFWFGFGLRIGLGLGLGLGLWVTDWHKKERGREGHGVNP